jgi:glutathione S-transferase
MNDTNRAAVALELLQFPFSHYNEKIRWVLDYKGIPHTRRSLLPGPHARTVKQATGQTATPVLRIGEHYLAGSSEIFIDLEHHFPEPPLLPSEREAKVLAIDLQRHFDRQLGPAVRTLVFADLLRCGRYLPDLFSTGHSPLERFLYRAVFPLTRPLIRRANGVDSAKAVGAARDTVRKNFDEIAGLARDTGYLAGSAFSIADLTAAALMAPLLEVDHPDMRMPEPRPAALAALTAAWADHPAAHWGRTMYERHRAPASPDSP